MIKFGLLVILSFGAFVGISLLFPQSKETAFIAFNHPIPWVVVGMCGIGAIGYKAIK